MTTLRFTRASLLYDISNYAYISGHRIEIDTDSTARAHIVTDVAAAGNVDRVNRVLAVSYAEVVAMLSTILAENHHCHSTSDEIWEPESYCIVLRRHHGLTHEAVHRLSLLIHEYMVSMAVYDWLSITHPQHCGPWQEKADIAQQAISALISGCRRLWRRAGSPF